MLRGLIRGKHKALKGQKNVKQAEELERSMHTSLLSLPLELSPCLDVHGYGKHADQRRLTGGAAPLTQTHRSTSKVHGHGHKH